MAAAVSPRRRSGNICFVTSDFAGVIRNGGIGTHYWLMARLLARRGWRVHVLFCGGVDDKERLQQAPAALAREGIVFTVLDDLPTPSWATIRHFGGDAPTLVLSERVLEALEDLHAEHRFDLIEFPDWGALALRPVQAKAAGDALLDVPLAVKLHSTSQWQREGNLQLRPSTSTLKMEFSERYAFEHADVQLSPSRYMLDYTRGVDWAVRDDAVVAYPYPDAEPEETVQVLEIRELVFFGRLEPRKGLHLFLDALDAIEPEMPALFLGKDTRIEGRQATELIAERLGDRPHRIETELNREQALGELRRGDRLAVIASRSETFGFTVAECVANRIPFVAAHAGGIPEVVDHDEGRRRWLFAPTADGLRDILTRRLTINGTEEIELRAEVAAACDPELWNDRVEAIYRAVATAPARPARARACEPPTVTVAVSHYNHDRFLPAALASLAAQTRAPDEVIVVDDGSTSESALSVFAEQESRYPEWTFLRQQNAGPGVVRNRSLERAIGTYFLPFDSDNIATPRLVERLVEAMERNPSRAATTCHNLAFVKDDDIEAGEFVFRYSPTGGPRLSACLENVYGDTCALFRAESLRSVGGFETHGWSPHEDWETFVKMAVHGLQVEVLPRPLFYYRTDSGGRLEALTADAAMTFRHRAHLVGAFFADAALTARERRELWECLLAFDRLSWGGVNEQIAWYQEQMTELRQWHDDQIEELNAWRAGQLEGLRAHLTQSLEAERARAEAAERELASRGAAIPPAVNRLLLRARRVRRRLASGR
jgi:O-antigen biosynthesis protein